MDTVPVLELLTQMLVPSKATPYGLLPTVIGGGLRRMRAAVIGRVR